jgi:hypothetical protein
MFADQLQELRKVTLAGLFCDNLDAVHMIQVYSDCSAVLRQYFTAAFLKNKHNFCGKDNFTIKSSHI